MRRLYFSLAALGFLGAMVGCHTAGVCDCAGPGNPCTTYGGVGAPLVPTQWSPVAALPGAEPARAMPKAEIRDLDAPRIVAPEKLSPPSDGGK
ncbi:MAG TPA: hypothetical protein VGX70_04575 [Gemmataceae bacterium]|jgi:hypothetical protein|nr:hypothetical protein [Gemmataceae bacterium]